ncbi:MAG: hypothetical protein QHI38_08270 [Armatimonadota bacterium]|nr:hypothetical protein [Armatimonadota bacterium]
MRCLIAAIVLASLVSGPVFGITHLIADQYDWQSKCGFYLSLESLHDSSGRCVFDGAKLVLGVEDGYKWHFLTVPFSWQFERTYSVLAVLKEGLIELRVDGKPAARSAAAWKPCACWLHLN